MAHQRSLDIAVSPHQLYQRIRADQSYSCILESAGDDSAGSRYTMIVFDPIYMVYSDGRTVHKRARDGSIVQMCTDEPFVCLRTLMSQHEVRSSGMVFAGGLIGYVSYDAVNFFEKIQIATHPDFYTYEFGMYLDAIVYDRQTGEYNYISHDTDRSEQVIAMARKESYPVPTRIGKLQQHTSRKEHAAQVAYTKEKIKGGYVFQCEVGMQKSFPLTGDPYHLYLQLREINPSPYMYYVSYGPRVIVGASPELLVRCQNGFAETFPLAGTRGRGKSPVEDRAQARELSNDPKERAEHAMLIDLHRNDLSKVCKPDTIKVRNAYMLKKFSHVQHLSTEICGILKKEADMFDLFAACFPVGTLTGTPKIEAMKIINVLESRPRGPYGGAVGFFGFGGSSEFAIAIRSIFISEGTGYIQACGGVVLDSHAQGEYKEIERKLAAVEHVLQQAGGCQ